MNRSNDLENKSSKYKYRVYMIIQFIILIIFPLVATISLRINEYITNPIEEYAGYSLGISGLLFIFIFMIMPVAFFSNSLNGIDASAAMFPIILMVVFLIIKYIIAFYLYRFGYKRYKTISTPIFLNILLSIWVVFVGMFWIVAQTN